MSWEKVPLALCKCVSWEKVPVALDKCVTGKGSSCFKQECVMGKGHWLVYTGVYHGDMGKWFQLFEAHVL